MSRRALAHNRSAILILLVQLLAGILACRPVTLGQGTPVDPHPTNVVDEGIFEISLAGRAIGTEKFKIQSAAGKIEAHAEVRLRLEQNGKTVALQSFPSLQLDPSLHPVSYTWVQKEPQSSRLVVNFGDKVAQVRYKTVNGNEDVRDFQLPSDVVVLDDNVVHHYQLIAARYQAMGGGKQTFHAFVPQEALPGLLTVEDLGNSATAIGGRTADLRHLVLTTDMTHVDLWVDNQQHIQRISVPEAGLEAIRKR